MKGWYNVLSRRGDVVGAIELDITVAEWRPGPSAGDDDICATSAEPISPARLGPAQVSENDPPNQSPSRLKSPSPHRSPSPRKSSSHPQSSKHREPPAAGIQEALVARLTVSVEEVMLPREEGFNSGLRELLQVKPTTPPQYYVVHGRYGEEEPCVSRAVQAQEGDLLSEGEEAGGSVVRQKGGGGLRVALDHSCEIEAPFDDELLKYLEQRLAVEVWKVEKVKSNPGINPHTSWSRVSQLEAGANRDRLVGTAFVGLSPLLDHGVAALGPKGEPGVKRATSMSGVFTLVHPDSSNLGDASVKVRVLLQVESTMEGESRVSRISPSMELADGASLGSPSAMGSPSETGSLKGTLEEKPAIGTRDRASDESDPEKAGRSPDHEESDDVDDEDWLQQRAEEALRRSADLHSTRAGGGKRSLETRAGSRQSRAGVNRRSEERQKDSGSEWDEERGEGGATARVQKGEGRLDCGEDEVLEGNFAEDRNHKLSRQTEQQSGRQPSSEIERQSEQANPSSDSASSPEPREGGRRRGDLGADEVRRSGAYRRAREEGLEGFEVSRGPAKRVAGHVTVTAPPKRGRTRGGGGRTLGQWPESMAVKGSGQGKPTTFILSTALVLNL